MAIRHYVLTLNGSAQRLSSVLTNTNPGGPNDEAFRFLTLQSGKANTNDIFVGGSTVSATDYGMRLDPTDTIPPIDMGHYDAGPVKLSEIYVIGTNNEKLHIFGVPF